MAPVSTHYGISGPVPFLDVDTAVDNKWFIDPRVIRLHGDIDPFAEKANQCTETFFNEVLDCMARGRPQQGLWLLQQFLEPRETRLGLARAGFNGHGGAKEVGSWIWDALNNDIYALIAVGRLKQIEDLPLFIAGIDRDITSDITTRIIFEALADFTARMVTVYPQFTAGSHRIGTFKRQSWDATARDWMIKPFDLPVVDGSPLLLVPRRWARRRLLMSAARYYETKVLDYVQLERAVRMSTGRLIKTPKEELMNEPGLGRGRATNLCITRRAHENGEDLIAMFKQFVDMRWTPPSTAPAVP